MPTSMPRCSAPGSQGCRGHKAAAKGGTCPRIPRGAGSGRRRRARSPEVPGERPRQASRRAAASWSRRLPSRAVSPSASIWFARRLRDPLRRTNRHDGEAIFNPWVRNRCPGRHADRAARRPGRACAPARGRPGRRRTRPGLGPFSVEARPAEAPPHYSACPGRTSRCRSCHDRHRAHGRGALRDRPWAACSKNPGLPADGRIQHRRRVDSFRQAAPEPVSRGRAARRSTARQPGAARRAPIEQLRTERTRRRHARMGAACLTPGTGAGRECCRASGAGRSSCRDPSAVMAADRPSPCRG